MMRMKFFAILFIAAGFVSFAQEENLKEREKQAAFTPTSMTYAKKEISYLTLKNGDKLEGYVKGMGWKKGQIKEIVFEVSGEKKRKIPASEIAEFYTLPSKFGQLSKMNNYFSDATKWGNQDVSEVVNKGYTCYTVQMVSLKNKKEEQEFLMQLVNPRFSKIISVYSDPWARETASIGVGSLKLAGGIAKSYYLKKGDKMIWITKGNFMDYFEDLFYDNEQFKAKYADREIKWSLLGVYILDYTEFN